MLQRASSLKNCGRRRALGSAGSPFSSAIDAMPPFSAALEGSGDSTDAGFASFPRFEILPSSPLTDDVCESVGSPPSSLVIRLPLSQVSSGNTAAASNHGSEVQGSFGQHSYDDYCPAVEHEGVPLFFAEEEHGAVNSLSLQSFSPSDRLSDRFQLINRLAEAAGNLQLNAQGLYLAVCLMDACLRSIAAKGRKFDSVQREILAVTCLYIACNQLSSLDLSPDEFVSQARVARGTVKGCMIDCQLSLVESLVGFSFAQQISFCSLWSFLNSVLSDGRAEHMAEFVHVLCGSKYAGLYFPDYLLQAALRVCSSYCSSRGHLESEHVLLNFLFPPLEAEIDMDIDLPDENGGAVVVLVPSCGTNQRRLYPEEVYDSLTCR